MDGWMTSTTVKTVVLPSERGSPVTKSKEMSDRGRGGTGTVQGLISGTNQTGFHILAHLHRYGGTANRVFLAPGWQETVEACTQ